MNFFEYLFCRLYWWNTKIIKESVVPIFYSRLGLAGFLGFTIVPFYGVIYVLLFKSYYVEDILGISPFVIIIAIVFVINVLYFSKYRCPILLKKFEKIPKEKKKKLDVLCIVYIATIIVVNVLFTIYFRGKNLGTI